MQQDGLGYLTKLLHITITQTITHAFGVAGPRLWNALPISLRQSDSPLDSSDGL